MLYHPWHLEDELLLNDSYEQKFLQVQDDIKANITQFEPYYEDVEHVLEGFDPNAELPEIWNELASQMEQERHDDRNVTHDPDHAHLEPSEDQDISTSRTTPRPTLSYSLTTTYQTPDPQYYNMLRSLNTEQRQLFDFIFNWASQTRLATEEDNNPVEPFYIFLSGGGGVGKTHTINTIYQAAIRALHSPGQDPAKPTILMTASTGKAASNINGTTLHSAFALPIKERSDVNFEFRKPAAEKLNMLRCQYTNLKFIIADEISMFGGKNFDHLLQSLQCIFENYSKPFGGISILAVGDLMQLNPVGDRPIFQPQKKGYASLAGSHWIRLFKIHELTQIIRQRGDPIFADVLSRVRTGMSTPQDIAILTELQNTPTHDFPTNTIHLYFTNAQA